MVIVLLAIVLLQAPLFVPQAQALSCLSISDYLKDVVGKEEIVIFVGTSADRWEGAGHTAEVLNVTEVKQGYAEKKIVAYHQIDPNWGYLCNNGPKAKGTTGLYVAERDAQGKYNVYQRLELNDPLIDTLESDLDDADIQGQVTELSNTDRMNQILTTISDLLKEIATLLKEYTFWKGQN